MEWIKLGVFRLELLETVQGNFKMDAEGTTTPAATTEVLQVSGCRRSQVVVNLGCRRSPVVTILSSVSSPRELGLWTQ